MKKDEQGSANFGKNVVAMDKFLSAWKGLGPGQQQNVRNKITLLLENRRHPSLNAHPLHQTSGVVWECYITYSRRLLYQFKDGKLWLFDMGDHSILDRRRLRNLATA